MRVAHISTNDYRGGAARAAYRLHESLLRSGAESELVVARKTVVGSHIHGRSGTVARQLHNFRTVLDSVPKKAYPRRDQGTHFSCGVIGTRHWVREVKKLRPDIVHLHWVVSGFLDVRDLLRISVPVVWSLHDLWPLTGGCHYPPGQCQRYRHKCGCCPALASNNAHDLSRRLWYHKLRTFREMADLTIVGVSSWMAQRAGSSSLLGRFPIEVIPNPLDVELFKPVPRKEARERLGLPPQQPIVLFGAMNATSDRNKGYPLLLKALEKLPNHDICLCVFGGPATTTSSIHGYPLISVGEINDDSVLCDLYCAADVMIVPSIAEAFGQTATEAMACGTPVVAFNATGLKDIVDHKINGYLAEPYQPADLARGMAWVLASSARGDPIRQLARRKAVDLVGYDSVGPKYLQLYRRLVKPSAD